MVEPQPANTAGVHAADWRRGGSVALLLLTLLLATLPKPAAAQTATICLEAPTMNYSGTPPTYGVAPAGWSVVNGYPSMVAATNPSATGSGGIINHISGPSRSGGAIVHVYGSGSSNYGAIQSSLTGLTIGQAYTVAIEWQRTQVTNSGISYYLDGDLFIQVQGNDRQVYTSSLGAAADDWMIALYSFTATSNSAWIAVGVMADSGSQSSKNPSIVFDAGNVCAQTGPDSDGDGLRDGFDLDDDNDGIPDAVENGACAVVTYAATEARYVGWYGDSPANTPNPTYHGTPNLTATAIAGGAGVNVTFISESGASIIRLANVNSNSFAAAVANNDYVFARVTVNGSAYPLLLSSTDILSVSSISGGSYYGSLVIIDLATNQSTTYYQDRPSPNSSSYQAGSYVMLPGRTYELRWYVQTGSTTSRVRSLDNPALNFQLPADCDTDGDGKPNRLDLDSDNDGILDITESGRTSGADTNGDGRLDGAVGIDGIPDSVQSASNGGAINYTVIDTDGDTRPDFLDLDSDNDGINDVREAGAPGAPTADANGDGKADGAVNGNGIPGSIPAAGLVPPDTDGDGKPDFRDLDSDNDAINDLIEGSAGSYLDANGDGIVDGNDSDRDGIKDAVDGAPTLFGDAGDPTPTNADNDGTPDYRDLDSDNDGLTDLRESGVNPAVDGNNDGKVDDAADPDNDGIPAPVDGAPATYGDANSPTLPDGNNNGTPDYRDPIAPTPTNTPVGPTATPTNTPVAPTATPTNTPVTGGTATIGDRVWNDVNGNGVQDIGERGIPGVTVQVLAGCAGTTVVTSKITNSNGEFVISGLPAGQYRLKVTLIAPYTAFSPKDAIQDDDYDSDVNPDGVTDCFALANGQEQYTLDTGFTSGGGAPTATPTNTPVAGPDTDGDGISDSTDLDDDNDGIPDTTEAATARNGGDTDGDGIPDRLDLDSDNDGILDITESGRTTGADANGDGRLDGPVGADGIPDSVQPAPNSGTVIYTVVDTDGDSRPDFQDLDSDNDGLNDVREANGTDANGDGQADSPVNGNGVPSSVPAAGLVPPDTDGDGKPDFRDLDSDNDAINDVIEGGAGSFPDTNGDGIGDGNDSDGDGIKDAVDGSPAFGDANDPTPTNTDADGTPDFRDLDSDNDGLTDLRESGVNPAVDGNNDGKVDDVADPDKDGIPAPVDGLPAAYGDAGNPALPDSNGNGTPDYRDPAGAVPTNTPTSTPVAPTATPTSTPVAPTSTPGGSGTAVIGDRIWNDLNGNGVQDIGERGVAGVTVQVLAGCSGATVVASKVTNHAGDYVIGNLPAGQYRIMVTLLAPYTGFSPKDTILDDDYDSDVNPDGVSDCFTLTNGQEQYTVDAGLVTGGAVPTATPLPTNTPVGPTATPTNTPVGPTATPTSTPVSPTPTPTQPGGFICDDGICPDSDGDGIADYLDDDDDNDGIPTADEDVNGNGDLTDDDSDGDGIPDYLDPLDTDGDTIPDLVEDANNDGNPANDDTDGDGTPDYLDLDSDNDGIPDRVEVGIRPSRPYDADRDRTPNYRDLDSDNDGKPDSVEGTVSRDGDGIPDYIDPDDDGPGAGDSDGDGVPDDVECPPSTSGATLQDTDRDGIPDYLDTDAVFHLYLSLIQH